MKKKEGSLDLRGLRTANSSRSRFLNVPTRESSRQQPPPYSPSWPTQPQPLENAGLPFALSLTVDVFLSAAAVVFFVLGIAALLMSGRLTTDNAAQLTVQFTKLGPTIFPILFAALVGRALRHIGRYKAEQGVRLSLLWPLMNCRTMFDTVAMQYTMRRATTWAFLLFLMWSMSPLGGQASLRLLYIANTTDVTSQAVRYFDTGPLSHVFLIESNMAQSSVNDKFPMSVTAGYNAAIMQGQEAKLAPVDSWGNVKVPRLEKLEGAGDEYGWLDFPGAASVEDYSSLLGLPLIGIPNEGAVEFPMESSYVTLNCHALPGEITSFTDNGGVALSCPTCFELLDFTNTTESSKALIASRSAGFVGPPLTTVNETSLIVSRGGYDPRNYYQREIHFETLSIQNTNVPMGHQYCNVTESHVESMVLCEDGACAVKKMRSSRTDPRDGNYTVFDYWGYIALNGITAVSSWDNADNIDMSSPTQGFLNDSVAVPVTGQIGGLSFNQLPAVDIALIDSELFAYRGAAVLNTFVQILLADKTFTNNLPSGNFSIYGPAHRPSEGLMIQEDYWVEEYGPDSPYDWFPNQLRDNPLLDTLANEKPPFLAAEATAKVTVTTQVFAADIPWVVMLLSASTLLVMLGVYGIWLSTYTLAPDMFDAVMGLTYHNPHIPTPGSGSTVGAAERARLMRDYRVRVGEVETRFRTGHIGIGLADGVKPLESHRMYV
ncbi:hypothetical protein MKZ38_010689 [Zalerion maritima]|uniref:Uncharacterized protein n=1 Tax=Zalerion maritima TaxID=339359 RepID=A0AAD5RS22_9PEZI|nr:hypothetical protein MKZ38_010689 [Zalerion maritima]